MREFYAHVCTMEEGVAGGAADVRYMCNSSQRHAQADNVVKKRNNTREAPRCVKAKPMVPGLPDPGEGGL